MKRDWNQYISDIKEKTTISETETTVPGYLISTKDYNNKIYTFWIPKKTFKQWLLEVITNISFLDGKAKCKDIEELMYQEVYTIYRMKTSVHRIVLFLLNFLYCLGILNFEEGYYILLKDTKTSESIINEFTKDLE